MKALVGAFNQEKALVGAFSVIVKTDCGTTDYTNYNITAYNAGHQPPQLLIHSAPGFAAPRQDNNYLVFVAVKAGMNKIIFHLCLWILNNHCGDNKILPFNSIFYVDMIRKIRVTTL